MLAIFLFCIIDDVREIFFSVWFVRKGGRRKLNQIIYLRRHKQLILSKEKILKSPAIMLQVQLFLVTEKDMLSNLEFGFTLPAPCPVAELWGKE